MNLPPPEASNGSIRLGASAPRPVKTLLRDEGQRLRPDFWIDDVPAYFVTVDPTDVYSSFTVLDTKRQQRAWAQSQRRRARAKVRAFRRKYPWYVRYPIVGRVVWWSLILATVLLAALLVYKG